MANEATKVELFGDHNSGDPVRYTCASGVAIAKGTILQLSDPRTAAAASSSQGIFAGIAAMSKASDDKSTSISAWTNGIFEMVASGALTIGQIVKSDGASNYITGLAQEDAYGSFAIAIGTALEAADAGETINVRVRI